MISINRCNQRGAGAVKHNQNEFHTTILYNNLWKYSLSTNFIDLQILLEKDIRMSNQIKWIMILIKVIIIIQCVPQNRTFFFPHTHTTQPLSFMISSRYFFPVCFLSVYLFLISRHSVKWIRIASKRHSGNKTEWKRPVKKKTATKKKRMEKNTHKKERVLSNWEGNENKKKNNHFFYLLASIYTFGL